MTKSVKDQPEISDGKIVDFIDGKIRKDSETEQIRQNFERTLIEEYNYHPEDVSVDFKIKVMDGSRKVTKTISLSILHEKKSAKPTQDDVYVLIMVVKPKTQPTDLSGGTEDLEKLLAACPNAAFACWSNGIETLYFQKKKTKFDVDIFPVNDFPRKGEDDAAIFTTDRSRLRAATGNNLLYAFKRCHDFIHANQGGSKEQIFWEFLKVLFAKIQDEEQGGRPQFSIRTLEERNTPTGHQLVKERIDALFKSVKKKSGFQGLFDDQAADIRFQPDVLTFTVAQLEKYDFLHSSVDVKGMAYETIVGPTLEGTRGEFFTPRNLVKMAVKMLDPKPGDRILDPACGTGGFIVVAFNYIAEQLRLAAKKQWRNPAKPTEDEERVVNEQIHQAGKNVFGIDFNANLAKTAQMNMVMNNDGRGGIYSVNSLWKPSAWPKEIATAITLSGYDMVITNPPFGTKIKVEGSEILGQYDLAHAWSKEGERWVMQGTLKTGVPPEILFIERCFQFLKPGTGKMAIVLPDGILGNPDLEYVRYWIMTNCQVLASVDLPVEMFLPRTGTQTSVLFLRRKSDQEKLAESLSGEPPEYSIFMAIAKSVGKDRRGNTIYKRDKEGREIIKPDLYKKYAHSTVLDFAPIVEPTGRIVNDDLPEIARLFREEF